MQNNPNDENQEPTQAFDTPETAPDQIETEEINTVVESNDEVAVTTDDSFESEPVIVSQDVSTPESEPAPEASYFGQQGDAAEAKVQPGTTEPVVPAATPVTQTTPSVVDGTPVASTSEDAPLVVPAAPVASKKSKKGLVIGLVIAAVLVVLGGGGAFAYNGWYQNPDKVVTDALINTIGARSVQLTGTADITSEDYTLKVAIDAKTSEVAGELAVNLEYTAGVNTVKLKGAGHLSEAGDLYVKVEDVRKVVESFGPSVGVDATAFDSLITKVDGNWIKISSDDLGQVSEEYKKTQVCLEDVANQIKTDKSLSKEVSDLYASNTFIIVGESLGSKDIKGVGSLGYVVDLDREKVKSFASGLATTKVAEKLKGCDEDIDFVKLAEQIDTSSEQSNTGRVELWASRFGHELTEVSSTNSEDGVESVIVLNPVFNKEVKLETPTNALTIEELKAEIEKAYSQYYSQSYSTSQYELDSSSLYN